MSTYTTTNVTKISYGDDEDKDKSTIVKEEKKVEYKEEKRPTLTGEKKEEKRPTLGGERKF